AARDAPQREVRALQCAVRLEGFERVHRAGGREAAGVAQPWRQHEAVAFDEGDQDALHWGTGGITALNSCSSSARTVFFRASDQALLNSFLPKAERSRTTCAACGSCASKAALTL